MTFDFVCGVPHIFFDAAVMSRDALMVRSRRSWCSSSSARKVSNMGRKGDCFSSVASIVSDLGRFWPIGRGSWVSLFKLLLLLLESFGYVTIPCTGGLASSVAIRVRIWFQTSAAFSLLPTSSTHDHAVKRHNCSWAQ